MLAVPWRAVSPSPNTGLEVIAPGRQGFRAKREFNPARGSAYLLWDQTPRLYFALPRPCPLTFLGDVSGRKPRATVKGMK